MKFYLKIRSRWANIAKKTSGGEFLTHAVDNDGCYGVNLWIILSLYISSETRNLNISLIQKSILRAAS